MPDEFDEVLYLSVNADVRELIAQGVVSTALEHWLSAGAFEHSRGLRRSGFYDYDLVYDEDAYLRDNQDVAAAVRAADFRDGYEHWIRFGRAELAEGRRNGCFRAAGDAVCPFRIRTGTGVEFLVAALLDAVPPAERLILRIDDRSFTLDPASVSCTPPIELTDHQGRPMTRRLLLVAVPPGVLPVNGQPPRAWHLIAISKAREVTTVNFADVVDEHPSFMTIESANEFVRAAKHLATVTGGRAALAAEVGRLACDRLYRAPRNSDQPCANVHAEHIVGIEGIGVLVSGWMIPGNSELARCRVWCPETGECVEFHATLVRTRRPDVWEAFRHELGTSAGDPLGFVVLLPLPEASRLPACRLVLGITPKGGVELVSAPLESRASRSFVDTAKVVLANLDLAAPDFEGLMATAIAPAIDALWSRERSNKTRRLVVSEFGERPATPVASVIVPIYGRSDLVKYQLALFANDRDFTSGSVELVYFVDDPRLIESTLQLCRDSIALYRVPMVVARTGENHGFSGANNLGASLARGELLVLLNSDVMPKRSGWVSDLVRAYHGLPESGVLGAKLLYHDESLQHDGMAFERFPFWNGLYGNNHPGKGLPNRSELDAPAREVEAVTGACMTIARSLYTELGGLSEEFVIGDFEDSELCLRVRKVGKRIYHLPSVELYHLERQSQSLLPDGDSWRWQLTVYNSWIQNRRWGKQIDELKRSPVARKANGSSSQ